MQKIFTDPNICHGKAHIVGTRIHVHIVLGLLAAGDTYKNILNAYHQLTEEDIMALVSTTLLRLPQKKWFMKLRQLNHALTHRYQCVFANG